MKHDKKTGLIATSDEGFDRNLNGENAVFIPTLILGQGGGGGGERCQT